MCAGVVRRLASRRAKAATSAELRSAFEAHLEETRGHVDRLERVFESLDEKARGKHCDGIAGIIEEGKSIMEEDFDEATMDACLIAAGWLDPVRHWLRWRPCLPRTSGTGGSV